MSKLVFASVISEIQQSDIFMTVKARICEAPAANLNGARVTEAFIDEIVSNEDRYVGLPLYADVRALTSGNYRRLGHLYDSRTGEFHSTQIGSFYQFEKEEFDGGCYLVGYARIAKRNKKLSKAISELFTDGALKFSFELSVGEYEELEDNTILIDVSDSNYLEGTAIVTLPACEEAVALELVAQRNADDTEGGEKDMAENEVVAEVTEEVAEVTENTAEITEVVAEDVTEEQTEETQTEIAEQTTEVAEQENAAVVVHEYEREEHAVRAYDTETGTSVEQHVEVSTHTEHVEPDAQIVEADDGVHIAEAGDDAGDSGDPAETPVETPAEAPVEAETQEASDGTNETASEEGSTEEVVPVVEDDSKKKTAELIAELVETVKELRQEIAELKETKVVAESRKVTAEVNPLMADIHSEPKYSLLEKEERVSSYSLLSR